MVLNQTAVHRGTRNRLPWLLAAVAGIVALLIPLAFDEAFWLAGVSLVLNGRQLYVDVIDNKSPAVYLTVALLDLLPGPYVVGRAVLFAIIAYWMARTTLNLVEQRTTTRARITAVTVTLTALLQVEWVFAEELPAIALYLGALAVANRGRATWAAALALASISFDPKFALLCPGLIALMWVERGRKTARTSAAWLTLGLAAAAVVVLAVPDLRYALIELNLAPRTTQASWPFVAMAVAAANALLPLIALVWALRPVAMMHGGIVAMLLAGLVIGILSGYPFEAYWTAALAPVPLLVGRSATDPAVPRRATIMVTLAFLPLLVNLAAISRVQAQVMARYQKAAAVLAAPLQTGDTFVVFDIKPYMTYLLPEYAALRSPATHYLTLDSSRTAAHVSEVASLLDQAEALADDGGLSRSESEVRPDQRELWKVYQRSLAQFPCIREVAGITLRFQPERCPPELNETA